LIVESIKKILKESSRRAFANSIQKGSIDGAASTFCTFNESLIKDDKVFGNREKKLSSSPANLQQQDSRRSERHCNVELRRGFGLIGNDI